MNSELEDYFNDLILWFFLYICIMSGVQQNRRFEVCNLGGFFCLLNNINRAATMNNFD